MAYEDQVLHRAQRRLDERRVQREVERDARERAAYERSPALRQLDLALRASIAQVMSVALREKEDATPKIAKLRRGNKALQAKRLVLLQELGIPAASLDALPFCTRCRDSGWQNGEMCSCLRALCGEEQIKELSHLFGLGDQRFSRFQSGLYDANLWPDYGRSPRGNMDKILRLCKDFAQNFPQGRVKNLYFYGKTGLGKTFLSACIAREVAERGYSVVYETMGMIVQNFEEHKFSRAIEDSQRGRELTQKYLHCELLIVDDLGTEMLTPFTQSALYQLVNTRLAQHGATIISSNLSPAEVEQRYSPQIASRIMGEYETLLFFGNDIRKLHKGR